jgi:hypothetical protein
MLSNLLRRSDAPAEQRLSVSDYASMWREAFRFDGYSYVPAVMDSAVAELTAQCAPLAAAMDVRVKVFSEARFRFQEMRDGRMGKLFGTPALARLEQPWAGAGSEHLLGGLEAFHSIYGNGYVIEDGGELIFLDPCKTIIVSEAVMVDGEPVGRRLLGYGYQASPNSEMVVFLPREVAHFRTTPDPLNPLRGQSWMRAVLSDASADRKMTGSKTALMDNSMVPGMVVRAEPGVSEEQFLAARDLMKARNTGWDKVGRTLMLGAGFDVKTVGLDFRQLDMKAIQGSLETRIAAAAGLPASIAGFSEGMQGSSLNAGNYGAARRRFADGTMRPLWRAASTALSTLITPPTGSRLWYDASDVSFLQEDEQDEATIRFTKAQSYRQLVDSGVNPDAAAEFVQTGDETVLLGQHSGLYSVQLQEPGAPTPTPEPARAVRIEDEMTPEDVARVVEATVRAVMPFQPAPAPLVMPGGNATHLHLPETRELVEVFGHGLEEIATRQATADDIATAVAAAVLAVMSGMPTPEPAQVTVNVPAQEAPQVHVDVAAPVVNVPAPNVTVNVPDQPASKTVKLKVGDKHVTGTITEA